MSLTSNSGRFATVLAVCNGGDGDGELLEVALEFARTRGASLEVLAVLELPGELARIAAVTGVEASRIGEQLVSDCETRLEELIRWADGDAEVTVTVRTGKPFLEVIRHAIERGAGLVLKTVEELKGLERYFFTSTDQHLIRKCPCAVWLRLPGGRAAAKSVVAAVDVDTSMVSEPETLAGLNRRILQVAGQMAGPEGVVHLLHVWDAPGEGLVRMWAGSDKPGEAAARYVTELEMLHRRALDRLLREAGDLLPAADVARVRLLPRLRRGQARVTIPEEVASLSADLLVLGTTARTGVPGFIIGNTAEDVLNSVSCSVVTVKPPGYHSPVEA